MSRCPPAPAGRGAIRLSLFVALSVLAGGSAAQPSAVRALPPWTPGTLDIHQIATGRGNAALFVFPDGTTMIVDAGAVGDGMAIAGTDPRPNATRRAGGWIIRYIDTMLAPASVRIDYAVLTHFPADHIGQVTPASPASASGAYRLTGITEVGDRIPIGTLIDRGAPSYDYLAPATDASFANYRAFVAEQQRTRGLQVEPLRVGRADQIVPRRAPGRYPTFEVRNVAANGEVWTGDGDRTTRTFPPLDTLAPDDRPSENLCSLALRIRYGRFDLFTGGDLPGVPDAGAPAWQAVEAPIARAIGPTDVHIVNHHGSIDPESPLFLATLQSRVMILPAWSPTHPSQDVLKRMLTPRLYAGPRDVFVTTLRESTRESIGSRAGQLTADHGHIVVRVAPGGDDYRVFVLDDTSDAMAVRAVFGPYASR